MGSLLEQPLSSSSTSSLSSPFRKDCLKGKFALITGGGSGICFEITRQLLCAGCSGVMICGRRIEFLQRACTILKQEFVVDTCSSSTSTSTNNNNHKNGNDFNTNNETCSTAGTAVVIICYEVCDVRIPEQCTNVIKSCQEHFNGQLDIVINGAAGNFLAPANTLTPKGFATVLAIDALGTFNISNAAYPLLSKSRRLRQRIVNNNNSNVNNTKQEDSAIIINISATLQYGATWWQAHASAAKAAVDSLTRSLALEWGNNHNNNNNNNNIDHSIRKRSIRVVGIAPGPIADTPGTTKLAPGVVPVVQSSKNENNDGTNRVVVQQRIPLGRMGYTYEIGYAAVFLCCSEFITGHTLVVDGGEWLFREPLIPYNMVTELSRTVEAQSRSQGLPSTTATTSTKRSTSTVQKSNL